MKLTKENAQQIAERMSKVLDGPVMAITIVNDEKADQRLDKNGLDKNGWCGESAKQSLPVKVMEHQIMWSTGYHSYWICFDGYNEIIFGDKMVLMKHQSASGNNLTWIFINMGDADNADND